MTATRTLEPTVVRMPDPAVREHPAAGANGFLGLGVGVAVVVGAIWAVIGLADGPGAASVLISGAGVVLGIVALRGLITVAPGEAEVLQFFGRYTRTVRTAGLRWVNPLSGRRKVSTRIRNHESAVLKVDDKDGNPIEIAAVVGWRVEDTATSPPGRHGEQPARGAGRRSGDAAHRQRGLAPPLRALSPLTAQRKGVLLRLDPAVHDALARWAADELRSTNTQIDYVIRTALAEAGRLPKDAKPPRPRGRPRAGD